MRKILLILLFSSFGIYAMGQQSGLIPVNQVPLMKIRPSFGPQSHLQAKNQLDNSISQWYDLLDEAGSNGNETYTTYAFDIFSDSTAKILYLNNGALTSAITSLNDVGEVFDPRFQGYSSPLSLYNTYTIDSVALAYLYHYVPERDTITPLSINPDGLVHDTLIFQFYTVKTAGLQTGAFSGGSTEPYATAKYNYKTNLGTGFTGKTVRYILGAKDSISTIQQGAPTPFIIVPALNSNNTPGIAVNLKNKAGFNTDLFAYTVSYRPGFNWTIGDTIDANGTGTPVAHPHSYFRVFQGQNVNKDMPANTYEMSLKVSSVANETINGVQTTIHGGQRYGKDPGWPGIYVAGTAWNAYDEVLYSMFHVESPNNSAVNNTITDPKGYILGNVYPNPANGNTKLDFAIPTAQNVTIKIYDMLGHELTTLADGQYSAGIHTVNFNTQNWKTGLYLYSISAGNFSKTLKFTVSE